MLVIGILITLPIYSFILIKGRISILLEDRPIMFYFARFNLVYYNRSDI